MKALKNSIEWKSEEYDKHGFAIKSKKKSTAEVAIPYSSLAQAENLQIHVTGYVNNVGRIDARSGKGATTLSHNMGIVASVDAVQREADNILSNLSKSSA